MRKTETTTAAKTKTLPYDVAEQLHTPEEMAAYLDAWLSDAPDDAAGIARALGNIAVARIMTEVEHDRTVKGRGRQPIPGKQKLLD